MYVDRSVRVPILPPLVPPLPVPATNPFNPFGMPVFVNAMLDGMEPLEQNVDSTLMRGVGSLHGKARAWDWDLSLLRSEEDAELRLENTLDPLRFMQVLANPDPEPDARLVPPGSGGEPGSPRQPRCAAEREQLRDRREPDQRLGQRQACSSFPAGSSLRWSGGEWRKESVQFDAALDSFEREVGAGFAELTIPVLGADMHLPAAARAEADRRRPLGPTTPISARSSIRSSACGGCRTRTFAARIVRSQLPAAVDVRAAPAASGGACRCFRLPIRAGVARLPRWP